MEYLNKLEKCIEQLGNEYNKNGGDNYFWNEADLQAELIRRLWDASLMVEVEVFGATKIVPLVHAEFPTRSKRPGQKKPGWFDVVLLTPEEVRAVIQECLPDRNYSRLEKQRHVLAALEIKPIWSGDSDSALREVIGDTEKIIMDINSGQVEYGYQLIFCCTGSLPGKGKKREPCDLHVLRSIQDKIKRELEQKFPENIEQRIHIYWALDHPEDKPKWLCRHRPSG